MPECTEPAGWDKCAMVTAAGLPGERRPRFRKVSERALAVVVWQAGGPGTGHCRSPTWRQV